MMNNNFNNGANNNDNNNFKGEFIMRTNTIATINVFADVVKEAFQVKYPDANVLVNEVQKNNNLVLTGLVVRDEGSNIAPTIYLEPYFRDYKGGVTMPEVLEAINDVYRANRVSSSFDVESVTKFNRVQDKVCYKLVNRKKNQALLQDVPFVPYLDLAVVFYIVVGKMQDGVGTILVRNNMLDIWGVTASELYPIALKNTQRMDRGRVYNMMEVIDDIISSGTPVDDDVRDCFYQMDVTYADCCPMFVCSNESKINGAGVIMYDGLLREFAHKIGSDFFILPSSIHETIFVPDLGDMDVHYLSMMVREVNCTEVEESEVLSDSVYKYLADEDRIVMM